ncbi:TPA: DUF2829 domain-containing protein [Vibrio cholerae]
MNKPMKLVPGLYYTLTIDSEVTDAYCYVNKDYHLTNSDDYDPNKDYSEIGFGFNIADGGGFLPAYDLREGSVVSLDFGQAVKAMKKGLKVSRIGWNGSGMFAYYVSGGSYPARVDAIKGFFTDDMVPYLPYFALRTFKNCVTAWVPSPVDVLTSDWFILELGGDLS